MAQDFCLNTDREICCSESFILVSSATTCSKDVSAHFFIVMKKEASSTCLLCLYIFLNGQKAMTMVSSLKTSSASNTVNNNAFQLKGKPCRETSTYEHISLVYRSGRLIISRCNQDSELINAAFLFTKSKLGFHFQYNSK